MAVRFLAAAIEAFFARAERSAAVMLVAAVLPPSAPVLRAISAIAARTAAGILIAITDNSTPKGVWIDFKRLRPHFRLHLRP